jgi:hypothetical protein
MSIEQKSGLDIAKPRNGIRPCERSDFPQVSKLYHQTFKPDQSFDNGWSDYFQHAFLDNPWVDRRFPSLVFEQDGAVVGFLGVVPRPMLFHGRPITVAVSCALMVQTDNSGKRNPLIGISLMKRFLSGEQNLSVTDTANDITRRLWTSLGGAIAYPYSYAWMRPIRPLKTCLDIMVDSPLLKGLATPAVRLGDSLLSRLPGFKPAVSSSVAKDIDAAELIELTNSLPDYAIKPDYDVNSLEWLIMMAEQSETEGVLVRRKVESGAGRALGCYVYYRNRSGIGRVLQLSAYPQSMDAVLDCLIHEASEQGLAALRGRTDSSQVYLMHKRRCVFQGHSWFLVHSSNQELISAFQNADALFSGFDGERWMKMNAEAS